MATFLFGYDVEYMPDPDLSVSATATLARVHQSRRAPATVFLLGAVLDARRDRWRRVLDGAGLDIAQHTWSHCLMVDHQVFGDAANEPEAAGQVARTRDLITEVLGRETIGLTTPCGNHGGLRNQETLLWSLWDEGIRYVRSDMRGPGDTLPAPLTQPYWYEEEGTPLMLETCGHGWHDCSLKGYTPDRLAWPPPPGTAIPAAVPSSAEEEFLVHRVSVDYALANDLVCVFCLHPWSLARIDPDMAMVGLLLDHILEHGGTVCSFQEFYEQELAKRPPEVIEAERRRETDTAGWSRTPGSAGGETDALSPGPLRENVPVVWEDLLAALGPRVSSDDRHCLDCHTGQLVMVAGLGMDPEEQDVLLAMVRADADRYVEVEPVGSQESYCHMAAFVETVRHGSLHDTLATAIRGQDACARFRDVLARHPKQRDRWLRFKQQKMAQVAHQWFRRVGIVSFRRVPFDTFSDESGARA